MSHLALATDLSSTPPSNFLRDDDDDAGDVLYSSDTTFAFPTEVRAARLYTHPFYRHNTINSSE